MPTEHSKVATLDPQKPQKKDSSQWKRFENALQQKPITEDRQSHSHLKASDAPRKNRNISLIEPENTSSKSAGTPKLTATASGRRAALQQPTPDYSASYLSNAPSDSEAARTTLSNSTRHSNDRFAKSSFSSSTGLTEKKLATESWENWEDSENPQEAAPSNALSPSEAVSTTTLSNSTPQSASYRSSEPFENGKHLRPSVRLESLSDNYKKLVKIQQEGLQSAKDMSECIDILRSLTDQYIELTKEDTSSKAKALETLQREIKDASQKLKALERNLKDSAKDQNGLKRALKQMDDDVIIEHERKRVNNLIKLANNLCHLTELKLSNQESVEEADRFSQYTAIPFSDSASSDTSHYTSSPQLPSTIAWEGSVVRSQKAIDRKYKLISENIDRKVSANRRSLREILEEEIKACKSYSKELAQLQDNQLEVIDVNMLPLLNMIKDFFKGVRDSQYENSQKQAKVREQLNTAQLRSLTKCISRVLENYQKVGEFFQELKNLNDIQIESPADWCRVNEKAEKILEQGLKGLDKLRARRTKAEKILKQELEELRAPRTDDLIAKKSRTANRLIAKLKSNKANSITSKPNKQEPKASSPQLVPIGYAIRHLAAELEDTVASYGGSIRRLEDICRVVGDMQSTVNKIQEDYNNTSFGKSSITEASIVSSENSSKSSKDSGYNSHETANNHSDGEATPRAQSVAPFAAIDNKSNVSQSSRAPSKHPRRGSKDSGYNSHGTSNNHSDGGATPRAQSVAPSFATTNTRRRRRLNNRYQKNYNQKRQSILSKLLRLLREIFHTAAWDIKSLEECSQLIKQALKNGKEKQASHLLEQYVNLDNESANKSLQMLRSTLGSLAEQRPARRLPRQSEATYGRNHTKSLQRINSVNLSRAPRSIIEEPEDRTGLALTQSTPVEVAASPAKSKKRVQINRARLVQQYNTQSDNQSDASNFDGSVASENFAVVASSVASRGSDATIRGPSQVHSNSSEERQNRSDTRRLKSTTSSNSQSSPHEQVEQSSKSAPHNTSSFYQLSSLQSANTSALLSNDSRSSRSRRRSDERSNSEKLVDTKMPSNSAGNSNPRLPTEEHGTKQVFMAMQTESKWFGFKRKESPVVIEVASGAEVNFITDPSAFSKSK